VVFRGVQHINLDAKGRLSVPARQRESLLDISAGSLVVTIDTQSSCLVMYPLKEWERIERDVQDLPTLNPAVRRFQRLVLGYASDLDLDANGRVLASRCAARICAIEKRVVLVGQGNKLELWSEILWDAECEAALAADGGDLPDELMGLKL